MKHHDPETCAYSAETMAERFLSVSYDMWKNQALSDLNGADFDKKLSSMTEEGILLKPIYTKDDLPDNIADYRRFHKANPSWLLLQTLDERDPEKYNQALHDALDRGVNAVVIQPDSVSAASLDPDQAEKSYEGVSVCRLEDIELILKDIDLEEFPVQIRCGERNEVWLMALQALPVDTEKINGLVTADPMHMLVKNGVLRASLASNFASIKRSFRWAVNHHSPLKLLEVNTVQYHNSGAQAVQELAFAFSTLTEYVTRLADNEHSPEAILRRCAVHFAIGSNYFMEVAKFRAFRKVWHTFLEAYHLEYFPPFITAETSSYAQTRIDPFTNVLRGTTESFSAMAGGVDGITVHRHDKLIRNASEFSRRLSRNIQLVLRDEVHLDIVNDPAGGSWYVEVLTEELIQKAWTEFQQIEAAGGILAELKQGHIQKILEELHLKREKKVRKRQQIIVGVNAYSDLKTPVQACITRENDDSAMRIDRIQQFRAEGQVVDHNKILDILTQWSRNAPERSIKKGAELLRAGATFGEITKTLTDPAEPDEKIVPLIEHRLAESFESLRQIHENYAKDKARLTVTLLNLGTVRDFKSRADFSRTFMEIGGYGIFYMPQFGTTDEAIKAAIANDSDIVVLCSSDEWYQENALSVVQKLNENEPSILLLLAGRPGENEQELRANGLDDFIYLGADAYALHYSLLSRKGVIR